MNINFGKDTKCCGCAVCSAVCPEKCISIIPDEEGFLYPSINKDKCIHCGLCEKKCPVINVYKEKPFSQIGYIVQHKNKDILINSTSGGFFTAVFEWIIKNGGYVVGAALDSEFNVKHFITNKLSDLEKFRNSKYVQSVISEDIYFKIKELLENGTSVCFSGTPCQIEALNHYLDKEYSNILYVDVVCRAIPSPLVFKKYIEYQEKRINGKIKEIKFRDKHYGYNFSTMSLKFDNNKNYYHGIESDAFLRCFFSNICVRPVCYECVFKKRYRCSDITIWDCFDYENIIKDLKKNSGASNVLIQSSKGKKVFESIKDNFRYHSIDVEVQVKKAKEMTNCVSINKQRKEFFNACENMNGFELFNKYYPIKIKQQILFTIRLILVKVGIYKFIKRILNK